MIPRWIHKLYADNFGFFWLPCPICHKPFGGHEAAETSLMSTASSGQLVCQNCGKKARQLNEKLFRDNPDIVYLVAKDRG
jgi:transcription elongation factor Elf1